MSSFIPPGSPQTMTFNASKAAASTVSSISQSLTKTVNTTVNRLQSQFSRTILNNPLNSVSTTQGAQTGPAEITKPTASFAFEQVAARLEPFRWAPFARAGTSPMAPIAITRGLVFPYNPIIREGIRIRYDPIELTHSNESYFAYRNTDNVRINIADATWTADTFHNAVYLLRVIHFFRAYSLMDFGSGRTGAPPSPMWFHAYGMHAFWRTPVLLEKATWEWPNDVDYVGVPDYDSQEFARGQLATRKTSGNANSYTWVPMVFKVGAISLIVQHSPMYWLNFNLDNYHNGSMVRQTRSFHDINLIRTANQGITQVQTQQQARPNTVTQPLAAPDAPHEKIPVVVPPRSHGAKEPTPFVPPKAGAWLLN